MPSTPTLYPITYEDRIGFTTLKVQISSYAHNSIGQEILDSITASQDFATIDKALSECREMIVLLRDPQIELPALSLSDLRAALHHIRPTGTFIPEEALSELLQMLELLHSLHKLFTSTLTEGNRQDESFVYLYPALASYLVDCPTFPRIEQNIRSLVDAEGHIRDNATRELSRIRTELRATERSISGALQRILRGAKAEGWIEEGVNPTLRDGRLVLPVSPQHKRKIRGIVHDESATGKTVYIEPVEIVETNNKIRDLEAEEERELIRILTEIANKLRPNLSHLIDVYNMMGQLDAISAKARWANEYGALCPSLLPEPMIEWYGARHPLLQRSLQAQGKSIVPLDISLSTPEHRILLISGPNAGGKSVCLKTVGLLQYMLQSGLPIPVAPETKAGVFSDFFLDIGDEQSLEDDLSTYSSHLRNMKYLVQKSSPTTLMLIDEFGGGTEPTIGGAIAQALLHCFVEAGAWGIITTHYQNLKTYADATSGLVNGAMLYDRHQMRPLFKLSIGRPGSSFAIEIARKIGLPERVIGEASELVGTDYIDSDKYLQDIIRDKRYWESKRLSIRTEERKLQEAAEKYTTELEKLKRERSELLAQARAEAKRLVNEAGSRIEMTIKGIKEAEAEREKTQLLRQDLQQYQRELDQTNLEETLSSERAQREVERILARRERRAKRGNGSGEAQAVAERLRQHLGKRNEESTPAATCETILNEGTAVRIEGQHGVGTILKIGKKEALVAMGMLKINVPLSRLKAVSTQTAQQARLKERETRATAHTQIIDSIHDKRLNFKTQLDLRGMRVSEATDALLYFMDEALQLGVPQVRILHGTGTGALRELVRSHLRTMRGVKRFADEHVQFGGAGITVVDME